MSAAQDGRSAAVTRHARQPGERVTIDWDVYIGSELLTGRLAAQPFFLIPAAARRGR
ncbi:hypothetical protein [Streptosporangium minutum]|uniref:hypothetical protein n=1 Tax=Streptosporangium minutum TaxID=569862 RepID=UPI0013FD2A1B|nr:hypothetical protein [Streptosporangium minutum]